MGSGHFVAITEGPAPIIPPVANVTMLTPPTATPSTTQVGNPITLTLGTYSNSTSVTGVLMQNGVNRTAEISSGVWTPAIAIGATWTVTATGPGGPIVNTVDLEIEGASEGGIDYATQSLLYIDANSTYTGTAEVVTGITPIGTNPYPFTTTGSGNAVQRTAGGFLFGDGVYLQTGILSNVPSGDGIFVVADVTLTSYGAQAGQILNQTGSSFIIRNNAGALQSTGPVSGQGTLALGSTAYGARVVIAARLDRLGEVLNGIDKDGATPTAIGQPAMPTVAPTRFQIGRYINGTIHRLAIVARPTGGNWQASLAEVFADFNGGAVTPPVPSVTTMELLPVFGQSENRSILDATDASALAAATSGKVYYTYGLKDENGASVGIDGARWNTAENRMTIINQAVPATGFLPVITDRVSPAFAFQYLRAINGPGTRGAVLVDHGYGGRLIEEWNPAVPEGIIGRNQNYWFNQSYDVGTGQGVTMTAPYAFWWQGMSEKTAATNTYSTKFPVAWTALRNAAHAKTGVYPKLVMVCNGADSNSSNDPGASVSAGCAVCPGSGEQRHHRHASAVCPDDRRERAPGRPRPDPGWGNRALGGVRSRGRPAMEHHLFRRQVRGDGHGDIQPAAGRDVDEPAEHV